MCMSILTLLSLFSHCWHYLMLTLNSFILIIFHFIVTLHCILLSFIDYAFFHTYTSFSPLAILIIISQIYFIFFHYISLLSLELSYFIYVSDISLSFLSFRHIITNSHHWELCIIIAYYWIVISLPSASWIVRNVRLHQTQSETIEPSHRILGFHLTEWDWGQMIRTLNFSEYQYFILNE